MSQRYSNYYVYNPNHQLSWPASGSLKKDTQPRPKFLIAVLVLGALLGVYFVNAKHTQAIEHKAATEEAAQKAQNRQNFVARVQGIINQNSNTEVSVSAIDLGSGSSVKVGRNDAMNAASCGKVLSAILFLHNVENGLVSLNDQLGGYSSRYQLQQLIQQSDDNAWVLLNDKLTHPALATYAKHFGLNSYNPDTNFIATNDMSLLLQKLYNGQLLNRTHTKLMLSLMQNTNYEGFISPAIPSGYQVYHKVGFTDGEINDAAIIAKGQQKMILSIFTNNPSTVEGSDAAERAELMQKITKAALLYLS